MPARNRLLAVLCAALLAGCAASPLEGGLERPAAPRPLSAVFSDFGMQVRLAFTPDAGEPACSLRNVEQRVARIGAEVAAAAYEVYPDLKERIAAFEFVVADKNEIGTVSNSAGRVVVLRPVEAMAHSDLALAFILAREVGHVVANHHDENTAASLIVSGLTYLVMPVGAIARLLTQFIVPGATTATAGATLVANASASATSFVGSRVLVKAYKPKQRDEADVIAGRLLEHLGFDAPEVARAAARMDLSVPANDWVADLRASVEHMQARPGRSLVVETSSPRFGLTRAAWNPPDLFDGCSLEETLPRPPVPAAPPAGEPA